MSDVPLDLREQIVRIDHAMAETHKLVAEAQKLAAEQGKLNAEAQKFATEQVKLNAEARKYDRDRWLAPVLAVVTVAGGMLGMASFIAKFVFDR